MKRKFFVTEEQLRQDYIEIGTMLGIAQKYGVSKRLIMNYMNKFHIVRSNRNHKNVSIDLLRKLANAGLTTSDARKIVGLGTSYIAKIAKENGFKFTDKFHPGFITRDRGYVMLYAYRHPYKNVRNCVMEHRLVAEKHLGRYLTPDEVVHHINRNPSDNRIENLVVMSKADHVRLHSREGRKRNK